MTPPRKPSPPRRDLTRAFLEELSEGLDLEKTIAKLGITESDARDMLRGLLATLPGNSSRRPPEESPEAPLFEEAVSDALETLPEVLHIYVDGASRGNPGHAGAGALLAGPDGRPVKKLRRYLGVKTNNVAEYEALILALETASSLGVDKVRVHADSELVVKQMKGQYKVKNADLKPLHQKARGLLDSFPAHSIVHVYRDKNKDADKLANEAIDRARK